MNKQKKNIPKKLANATVRVAQKAPAKQSSMSDRDRNIALLTGVAIIIFICFRNTLNNQFLNWDDWIYIQKDKYITAFTAANLHALLFRNITLNYYHPVTMLSLALNYQFSQLNPTGYYFTNVVLHIVNAIMVFYLTKTLMDAMVKIGYKAIPIIPWLLAVGALLHGIHPMHVESVSWIAERKDVIYSIIYFAGLIMYVKYLLGEKFRWMLYLNIVLALGCVWGMIGLHDQSLDVTKKFSIADPLLLSFPFILLVSLIVVELKYNDSKKLGLLYVMEFFLLSMFSKPMAVSFPLSIIVIDFLFKRDVKYIQQGKNLILSETKALFYFGLEKWMFFVIALLSGIQSAYMQTGTNSLAFTNGYTVTQKLLIACYTFTMYTFKAFYPANLCNYYPFPNLNSQYHLPSIFYMAPFLAAAIVFIPLLIVRKDNNLFRVVLFGLCFYFVNLVFVLQFISSGTTIISERYSYVAYFGLIFMLVYFAHWFWQKNKSSHIVIQGSLASVCVIFFYLSYERTKVWHNPETLWTDAIAKDAEQQPPTPYLNLASYYIDSGKYDKAFVEYSILSKIGTKDPLVFRNLAMVYGMRKQFDSSLYFFSRALKYDTTDPTIYNNRAITYANLGKFDFALNDFSKAYALDTTQEILLVQKAGMLAQLGKYPDALVCYNKLIQRNPKEPSYYLQRGYTYLNGGNPDMAMKDYTQVLQLQPKSGDAMYAMSFAYHKLNDNAHALQYANMAQTAGFKLPEGYLNTLK